MSIDIKAPTFPESVQDGTIATWHKQSGDSVKRDELIVDIETDKVMLEVVAPSDGVLGEVLKEEGDTVESNEIIAKLEEGAGGGKAEKSDKSDKKSSAKDEGGKDSGDKESAKADAKGEELVNPAARKLAEEEGVDLSAVEGTGKGGRITKEDVLKYLKDGKGKGEAKSESAPAKSDSKSESKEAPRAGGGAPKVDLPGGERTEKRVPMTRLRARVAERLVDVKRNTAMLTTFNEVDMAPLMALRKRYKERFEKVHNGTRLGFMGFFVKAAVEALKRFPAVNASVDNNDIVYHGYFDVGVAVSTERGLVVPVLRDADAMAIADVENKIVDFAGKARDGKLSIEDMTGGTFTITNGGVFGSLMSTPILNPPQTAILGMHKIQERPVAIDGEVVVRPMMYLALSYDHRLIDGKDAVQFLVAIKDLIEDPARILLDV